MWDGHSSGGCRASRGVSKPLQKGNNAMMPLTKMAFTDSGACNYSSPDGLTKTILQPIKLELI